MNFIYSSVRKGLFFTQIRKKMLSLRQKKFLHNKNNGFSLVEIMVAAVLLGGISMAGFMLLGKSFPARRLYDIASQQEVLKKIVLENMDCRQTLEIKNGERHFMPPGRCKKKIVLRDRFGRELFPVVKGKPTEMQPWSVWGECNYQRGSPNVESLVVKRELIEKQRNLKTKAEDLFEGVSLFCHEFMSAPLNTCDVPKTEKDLVYNIYGIYDTAGVQCCRFVDSEKKFPKDKKSNEGIVQAQCGGHEYMAMGAVFCSSSQDYPQLGKIFTIPQIRESVSTKVSGSVDIMSLPPIPSVPGHIHMATGGGLLRGKYKYSEIYDANKRQKKGGFLAASAPFIYVSNSSKQMTLGGMTGMCMRNDWRAAYGIRAWAVCCPKV
jgi:prepilin-type N-terminal cleavage/methylation domain-containing protein